MGLLFRGIGVWTFVTLSAHHGRGQGSDTSLYEGLVGLHRKQGQSSAVACSRVAPDVGIASRSRVVILLTLSLIEGVESLHLGADVPPPPPPPSGPLAVVPQLLFSAASWLLCICRAGVMRAEIEAHLRRRHDQMEELRLERERQIAGAADDLDDEDLNGRRAVGAGPQTV